MLRYETHLHTYPVSRCGKATVKETLEFYKEIGYDGVFITNHFLDGNINMDKTEPYEKLINFYFSDYEEGLKLQEEIGIKVFLGIEVSLAGTDFLVYGLDKEWFLKNPQIVDMKKSDELKFFMENGALVIQAHPFREAAYIDHIRLFPRSVHGVEIINACRNDFENSMAKMYADSYELIHFAGSDNHIGKRERLAGMCCSTPLLNELDFINRIKNNEMEVFELNIETVI